MADKCKTGQVYNTKLKKCVTKEPWDKYMSGGEMWLKNKATKQEKAVVDLSLIHISEPTRPY